MHLWADSLVSHVQARAIRSAIGKAVIGAECDRVPHPSGTSSQQHSSSVASCHIGCRPTSERNGGGGRFGFITSSSTSRSNSSCISSPLSPASTTSTIGRDASASPFGSLPMSEHSGGRGQKADLGATAAVCHSDGTGSDAGSLNGGNSSPAALPSLCHSSQDPSSAEFKRKEAATQPRSINFADGVGSSNKDESHQVLEGDSVCASSGAANGLSDDHMADRGTSDIHWQYHHLVLH